MKNLTLFLTVLIGAVTPLLSTDAPAFEGGDRAGGNASSTVMSNHSGAMSGEDQVNRESMNSDQREKMMRMRRARLESMSPEQREQMARDRRAR
ncbi:MAG: hypothetical protein ACPHF3_09800, partial [Pseudomonadales bacterium]